MRLRLFGSMLFLVAPVVAAQDTPEAAPPPPPPWSGEASAGIVVTSGNTESSTVNAKGELVYQSKVWRNTSTGNVITTEQTDAAGLESRTAERYAAGNKTDFNFTDRDYAFLALDFEKDLVGPVRQRMSETIGYGRKILTGPKHTLEAELGGGARQTEAQGTLEKESEFISRGRIAYKWTLSDTSYITETAKVESGDSNTSSESVTELRVTLVGKLFAVASFTARQNSDVPPGTEKTDTITSISLGWTFNKTQ
jgi:putative salt-induced outer membrane protein